MYEPEECFEEGVLGQVLVNFGTDICYLAWEELRFLERWFNSSTGSNFGMDIFILVWNFVIQSLWEPCLKLSCFHRGTSKDRYWGGGGGRRVLITNTVTTRLILNEEYDQFYYFI